MNKLYPAFPYIINQTLTSANTEYMVTLPHSTVRFQIQARTTATIKLAFNSGESGTTYWTLKGGMGYWEVNTDPNGRERKLYLQTSSAGTVIEIICWRTKE